MKVRFFNIEWDFGGVPVEESDILREATLDVADDLDVAKEGAEVLVEQFGWFGVFSFDFQLLGSN